MHPGFIVTARLTGETQVRFWISWCREGEKVAKARAKLRLYVVAPDAWNITEIV